MAGASPSPRPQRLSVKRDEDVDKEPTYALSCRCGTFKWTIPKLPFARFETLDGAIKQPPLRPSLAFPRRTRFLRAPPAETALDAWCDILSQNVRAAALEPPTTDLADALDALGEILRLDEAKPNIDAAGAVLEKPQLQTKTPRRPATNGAKAARDASVDRRLDSVAAKLRALRKGRTGRKPGKRPSRRALAALRVDAPRSRTDRRRRRRRDRRPTRCRRTTSPSAAGRRPSPRPRRRRCCTSPRGAGLRRPVGAGPHDAAAAAAAGADGVGDGDAPARAINTSDGGRHRDARLPES